MYRLVAFLENVMSTKFVQNSFLLELYNYKEIHNQFKCVVIHLQAYLDKVQK